MKPLISVIVPVYKVEEYLPKCVDSIVNQTYRNLEIILVDDGSPDNCGALCDRYEQLDERVRVIHQENGGLPAARNAGLDVMQGEYLMFVDSDDWLATDAIEVLYERLQKDGSDMAIGNMVKVFDDRLVRPAYSEWIVDSVITGREALSLMGSDTPLRCNVWSKLYKRSIFWSLRFPHLRCGEDLWVLPYVFDACDTISLDSGVLYYYYQRTSSIIHSVSDTENMDHATSAFSMAQFLSERGLWKNAVFYSALGLSMLQQIKDERMARAGLQKFLDIKDWKYLLLRKPRCLLWILGLHYPNIYRTMRKCWRKLRHKES